MRRSRRYLLCLVLASAGVPALFVGSASLASNHVAPSSMGDGKFSVQVPTTLAAGSEATVNVSQAVNKGYLQFDNMRADLAAAGVPLAGEQVEFKAGGVTICTDATNNVGRASCPGGTKVDTVKFSGSIPTSFTATFTGDGGLQGATDTGTLTAVG